MSRAKAKLAILKDLQCKNPNVILVKKDCDMIAYALEQTFASEKISKLANYFRRLGRL